MGQQASTSELKLLAFVSTQLFGTGEANSAASSRLLSKTIQSLQRALFLFAGKCIGIGAGCEQTLQVVLGFRYSRASSASWTN